ncbi:imidazole glycerol phosphate synthase subunit HisF [bacterium]|nr:imidazole glycerol phosphate synthase subunit HisF [bacterium]
MLCKRIIPCLDVASGRVVKGTNFVDLRDAGDPIELARLYNDQMADELVFLDITASHEKRYILKDLVSRVAKEIFIPFTVGGGINDLETIQDILHCGADKVSINSAAVANPSLIENASRKYGAQCIVVAIDVRKAGSLGDSPQSKLAEVGLDSSSIYEVVTHGGRKPTGIDAVKWAAYVASIGAGELLVTSMDKDGTKSGYDLPLNKAIVSAVSIPVIASGGAGTAQHVVDALHDCDAALLASLLHYRETTVSELKSMCRSSNIPVR